MINFCQCQEFKYYIDGQGYFNDLYDSLILAQNSVFITGLWLIPQYYLVRPVKAQQPQFNKYRLDNILKQLGQKGVKIYILIYNQATIAANFNSQNAINKFKGMKNVFILRHPKYNLIFKWSHHQKMVVIDGNLIYTGGLDICYGRYDNKLHTLKDNDYQNKQYFPGLDYYNPRLNGIASEQVPCCFKNDKFNKKFQPRMPWHDIGIRMIGDIAIQIGKYFVDYWKFALNDSSIYDQEEIDQYKNKKKIKNFIKQNQHIEVIKEKKIEEKNFLEQKISLMKEMFKVNLEQKKIEKFLKEHQEFKFSFCGRSKIEPEINQIQKIKQKPQVSKIVNQLPQFIVKKTLTHQKKEKLKIAFLKSGSLWSNGYQKTVSTIHQSYLKLINQAKHYIYIENQFFISINKKSVNKIALTLAQKIIKYQRDNPKQDQPDFQIVIFITLVPEFDQNIKSDNIMDVGPLRATIYYQLKTICRGQNSIFGILTKANINPYKYIRFYSLRQHGLLQIPVTQIIYIHSKLMIVDDVKCIIGSANINDRSLKGTRDSQIAVLIQDTDLIDGQFGTKMAKVGRILHKMRKQLYMQHFNITEKQAENPMSLEIIKEITRRTEQSRQIYFNLWQCYPDNNYRNIKMINKKNPSYQEYMRLKDLILCNAIPFPLDFLFNFSPTTDQQIYRYLTFDILS